MASRLGRGKRSSASHAVEGSNPAHPDRSEGNELFEARPARRWTRLRKAGLLVGILLVAGVGAAYGYDRATTDHYYPGTRIGVVDVGSLTADAAASKLHETYVEPLRKDVTLVAPEFSTKSSPWKMGMRVDVNDAARDALVRQQVEMFPVRLWHRAFGDPERQRIKPSVDDKLFGKFLEGTYEEVNQDPVDARMQVTGDSLSVTPHTIGRKVDKKAAERSIFAALTTGQKEIEIPVDVIQPAFRTEAFNRVILVNTNTNKLVLYTDGKASKRYGVATGTGGHPTPLGQWVVTLKRTNPTWYNPNSEWSRDMPPFIPPGPNNPLGTRALNLNASGIRIHGTPDADSIGTNASHGCIRMHMSDVEDLFERVEVGTPVLII